MKPLPLFIAGLSFMVSAYAQIPAPFSHWQQVNDPNDEQEIVLVNPQDIQPVQGQPHLRMFSMHIMHKPPLETRKFTLEHLSLDYSMTLNCLDNTLTINSLVINHATDAPVIVTPTRMDHDTPVRHALNGTFISFKEMASNKADLLTYQNIRHTICN